MPIFRIGQQLHFYAHVPKCGGSSVEQYLSDRFGALGFYNPQFHADRTEPERWSKTSAQHVDWATASSLVPEEWIASAFTVVRHPVARIVSSFQFQRDVEGLIGADETFDDWFARWVEGRRARPFAFDNHLRPQSEIAPSWARVFPLEAGLDALVPYLDGLAGDQAGGRSIPVANESRGGAGRREARSFGANLARHRGGLRRGLPSLRPPDRRSRAPGRDARAATAATGPRDETGSPGEAQTETSSYMMTHRRFPRLQKGAGASRHESHDRPTR